LSAVQRDSKSAEYDGYSHDASKKQLSRLKGVAKATDRLTKESEQIASDLEESNDHVSQLLADKDINSTVSGQTVKVHKSNVAAASKIIKAAGYSHSVVGGLNESEITESVDPKIAMYASMLSGNLIKE
jgi:ribosomal protein L9